MEELREVHYKESNQQEIIAGYSCRVYRGWDCWCSSMGIETKKPYIRAYVDMPFINPDSYPIANAIQNALYGDRWNWDNADIYVIFNTNEKYLPPPQEFVYPGTKEAYDEKQR